MPQNNVIGVDLGGTKTFIGRFLADSLKLDTYVEMPTNAKSGLQNVFKEIAQVIQKMKTADTLAVGIGIPGLVALPEGIVIHTPNISGGEGVRAKEILQRTLDLPVFVDNDARCFTLAEAHHGVGKGKRTVVGITIGTGVGGGIVINGRIFHGSHGFAGEIGHMLLHPGIVPYDTKDKRGDVEQYVSGTAMGKRCSAAKKPQDYLEGQVCAFLQPKVFEEIAQVVASLTYLLDPDIIIFGGSAGKSLAPHIRKIAVELTNWTMDGTPLPEMAISTMSNAGALGAAILARPTINDDQPFVLQHVHDEVKTPKKTTKKKSKK